MAWGPGRHGDSQASAVGCGKGTSQCEGPQALPGGSILCALGPEAEGAELKITGGSGGHLCWPDPPSRGDSCSNSRPAGTFRAHFLLLLPTPPPPPPGGIPRRGPEGGGGGGRVGALLAPLGIGLAGRGPDPPPFSPTGYQLRSARWGSKCNPQPAAPRAPTPQCWVGVSACPHLAIPCAHPSHHTAPWP